MIYVICAEANGKRNVNYIITKMMSIVWSDLETTDYVHYLRLKLKVKFCPLYLKPGELSFILTHAYILPPLL